MSLSRIFCVVAALLGGSIIVTAVSAGGAEQQGLAAKITRGHCAACHTFGTGEPHGQGPNLYQLIGREAGSGNGFSYSEGFLAALTGKVWTVELLDAWLTDSQALAPDTGMTYFQDDEDVRALIIECLVKTCVAQTPAP